MPSKKQNNIPEGPDKEGKAIEKKLAAQFGPVKRIGGGYQSRVYIFPETNEVMKVYRESLGLNRLEASNMIRAGLSRWVIGAENLGNLEILRLRHFAGLPITKPDILPIMPSFKKFLSNLHSKSLGETINLAGVRSKLERFKRALRETELAPLFANVRNALHNGELEVQPRLCHLDLHRANILISQKNQLLVVDWTRSDWDDPARDCAIFFTGTLNLLPTQQALELVWKLATQNKSTSRLASYIALQTLHDLYWFKNQQTQDYAKAFRTKVPRAIRALTFTP